MQKIQALQSSLDAALRIDLAASKADHLQPIPVNASFGFTWVWSRAASKHKMQEVQVYSPAAHAANVSHFLMLCT